MVYELVAHTVKSQIELSCLFSFTPRVQKREAQNDSKSNWSPKMLWGLLFDVNRFLLLPFWMCKISKSIKFSSSIQFNSRSWFGFWSQRFIGFRFIVNWCWLSTDSCAMIIWFAKIDWLVAVFIESWFWLVTDMKDFDLQRLITWQSW